MKNKIKVVKAKPLVNSNLPTWLLNFVDIKNSPLYKNWHNGVHTAVFQINWHKIIESVGIVNLICNLVEVKPDRINMEYFGGRATFYLWWK